jgi:hypothetical protein
MTIVTTRIRVARDGTLSGRVPHDVPAGEHEAMINVTGTHPKQDSSFDVNALPSIDLGPWPAGVTLRREDIYGADGR